MPMHHQGGVRRGWFQLERDHADLHDAQDQLIKMTIGRGAGCDGGAKAVVLKKKLPLAVRLALIKAAKPPRRSRKPSAAGRVALLAENRPSPGSAGLVER